jgi:hypothetical protein
MHDALLSSLHLHPQTHRLVGLDAKDMRRLNLAPFDVAPDAASQ